MAMRYAVGKSRYGNRSDINHQTSEIDELGFGYLSFIQNNPSNKFVALCVLEYFVFEFTHQTVFGLVIELELPHPLHSVP